MDRDEKAYALLLLFQLDRIADILERGARERGDGSRLSSLMAKLDHARRFTEQQAEKREA